MRVVIAVGATVLMLSARGVLALCCQCAGATNPPTDLCSEDGGFCSDGASVLCAQLGGTFSMGPPASSCQPSELGELCSAVASPAPLLSGDALGILTGALLLLGYCRVWRKMPH